MQVVCNLHLAHRVACRSNQAVGRVEHEPLRECEPQSTRHASTLLRQQFAATHCAFFSVTIRPIAPRFAMHTPGTTDNALEPPRKCAHHASRHLAPPRASSACEAADRNPLPKPATEGSDIADPNVRADPRSGVLPSPLADRISCKEPYIASAVLGPASVPASASAPRPSTFRSAVAHHRINRVRNRTSSQRSRTAPIPAGDHLPPDSPRRGFAVREKVTLRRRLRRKWSARVFRRATSRVKPPPVQKL
jgi:hypothetical protein